MFSDSLVPTVLTKKTVLRDPSKHGHPRAIDDPIRFWYPEK